MSIFSLLDPHRLPHAAERKEPLANQREIVLQYLLNTVSAFVILGLLLYLARTPVSATTAATIVPFILSVLFLLTLTLARRWPYLMRACLLIGLLAIECGAALGSDELSGTALIYAVAVVSVTAVLFNARAGMIALILILFVFSCAGWLMIAGRIPMPVIKSGDLLALSSSWMNILLAYLLTAAALIGALHQLTVGLSGALDEQRTLTDALHKERSLLETRVAERTRELTAKTEQLEAARHIASAIAAESAFTSLLDTASRQIMEQFRLARVAVYLREPDEVTLELRSSASADLNLPPLAQHLRLDEPTPVSRVALTGSSLFSAQTDTGPHRPSELLVPVNSGARTRGVIVLQSYDSRALASLDSDVYTAVASQLGLAVEKSQILERLEQSLQSVEENYRLSTQKSWNAHLKGSRKRYAYRYARSQTLAGAPRGLEAAQALQDGATIISAAPDGEAQADSTILAVPIKLRNQTIGVLNMRVNGSRVSPELVNLVENAVGRLAISLENARLLEDIQNRADRERLVGEIANKVRSATDIESILRATAGELGKSLGVAEVVVQLNHMK